MATQGFTRLALRGAIGAASLLLAVGVAARRWRGVAVRPRLEEPRESAQLLEAEPQTPDAPKSRPRR